MDLNKVYYNVNLISQHILKFSHEKANKKTQERCMENGLS